MAITGLSLRFAHKYDASYCRIKSRYALFPGWTSVGAPRPHTMSVSRSRRPSSQKDDDDVDDDVDDDDAEIRVLLLLLLHVKWLPSSRLCPVKLCLGGIKSAGRVNRPRSLFSSL